MNKSKQEFVKELNQQFVEYKEWMLEMPRRVTTLELAQRKNPFFFREVKLIEIEGDWTRHLVKSQFLKGIALTPKGWRLKVEVHLQETFVDKDPETQLRGRIRNPDSAMRSRTTSANTTVRKVANDT